MSDFSTLYDYCQNLQPKVSTKKIADKVKEIRGKCPKIIKTSGDNGILRGFFVSSDNLTHNVYKNLGTDIIFINRELNHCWYRFVYTKELMHIFDSPLEHVNTDECFKTLLSDFEVQSPINNNAPFNSETLAFWRALSCLCPEKSRQEFLIAYTKGHIDTYGIALQLRIPEQYIPKLLDNNFLKIIEKVKS